MYVVVAENPVIGLHKPYSGTVVYKVCVVIGCNDDRWREVDGTQLLSIVTCGGHHLMGLMTSMTSKIGRGGGGG